MDKESDQEAGSSNQSPLSSDNLSDDNEYSNSESENDSSQDEGDYGIATDMPKRITKANRYSTVMLEAEDEFWQHETWQEENNDEEYLCSEGEEQYKDIIDSDFDESEDEEKSEEYIEDTEAKTQKRNVYQDPSLIAKRLAKKKVKDYKKLKVTSIKDNIRDNALKTLDKFQATSDQMKTRKTTREKSEQIEILRKEREFARKRKASKRTLKGGLSNYLHHEPTQAEHLKEAQQTEEANKQSLLALQEWEEERKRYIEYKKQKYQGHYTIWISWASDRLIMSDETARLAELDDEFDVYDPEVNPPAKYFKSDQLKEAPELLIFTDGQLSYEYTHTASETITHPKCVVTGNKAKYIDPLTKCFYDSLSSFKILRQWYYDAQDIRILSELKEIEKELQIKVNETNIYKSNLNT